MASDTSRGARARTGGTTASRLLDLGREAARLVVPLACAGCGAWDVVLCETCRDGLTRPRRVDGAAPDLPDGLPVWGLGHYRDALLHLVLSWKTGGRRDVDPLLARALDDLVGAWLAVGPDPGPEVWVVPAPSGPMRTLRGRPPVADLADAVARALARRGHDTRVVLALAHRGSARHHATAGRVRRGPAPGRRRGPRHARVAARLDLSGRVVVLVDDVLTTGATLQRCRSAVLAAGGEVPVAVVLASVGRTRDDLRLTSGRSVD